MKGHEEPFIVQGNDTPLEVGECFSIEPGIYLPDRFGIRIENIVTVTPDGHHSFNEEPADTLLLL
jgi:Xaa-Pro dipeptidase